jgi:hypothetical protein
LPSAPPRESIIFTIYESNVGTEISLTDIRNLSGTSDIRNLSGTSDIRNLSGTSDIRNLSGTSDVRNLSGTLRRVYQRLEDPKNDVLPPLYEDLPPSYETVISQSLI